MRADEAFDLLAALGGPPRLITHATLVLEAADELLATFAKHGVPLDHALVRAGVVLHDAGKARHPEELAGAGAQHEPAGEAMLLERGVAPEIARICRSHAQWRSMTCRPEELVVALADKLWKGVRSAALEERFIDVAATLTGGARWTLFVPLDDLFERVANHGPERLARST